uniref:Uncharacterized protein n=1 Tax=Sparus aurata TaxID=8175 RepID=A0A671UKI2_SPAAU
MLPESHSRCSERPSQDLEGTRVISIKEHTGATVQGCRPLATLSAFSYIPPRRKGPKEMSIFNTDSRVPEVSMYDQVFHQAEGYDMRLPRDERNHYKAGGLEIYEEVINIIH